MLMIANLLTSLFHRVSPDNDLQLSPGTLYHADDEECAQTLSDMIHKPQKEVLSDLYNKLSKMDVTKSPGPKTLLKVTTQSIEKLINATKGKKQFVLSRLFFITQILWF